MVSSMYLWIGQHSKVIGKNKDSHRHMFNFVVDSVSKRYKDFQKKGIVFIASPFKAPAFENILHHIPILMGIFFN